MVNNVINKKWVKGGQVIVDNLTGTAFTGESGAHTFRISGVDAHQAAVDITGTITAKFLAANNVQVPLTGALEDGAAVVTLTEACYQIPGRYVLSIFATNDGTTLCIYCGVGNVFCTSSDTVQYPSAALPDLNQLMLDVQELIGEIPTDYSELRGDVSDLKSALNITWMAENSSNILLATTFATEVSGASRRFQNIIPADQYANGFNFVIGDMSGIDTSEMSELGYIRVFYTDETYSSYVAKNQYEVIYVLPNQNKTVSQIDFTGYKTVSTTGSRATWEVCLFEGSKILDIEKKSFRSNYLCPIIFGASGKYISVNTTDKIITIPTDTLLLRDGDAPRYYVVGGSISYAGYSSSALKIYFNPLTAQFGVSIYSAAVPDGCLLFAVIRDNGADTTVMANGAVVIDGNENNLYQPDFSPYNENLFSELATSPGYIATNGDISTPSDKNERVSEYIPVVAGKIISIYYNTDLNAGEQAWFVYAFYDANKSLIDTRRGGTTELPRIYNNIVVPSNAVYVRVSGRYFSNRSVNISVTYGTTVPTFLINPGDYAIPHLNSLSNSVESLAQQKARHNHVVKEAVHRGLYGYPENTLIAFQAARKAGFAYIETDVQRTSDGVYVLLHDPTINRTARNADGTAISDTVYIDQITYSQALEYDFGIYKGQQFAGTKIPTLEQLLLLCREIDLDICLEVKNEHNGMTQAQVEGVITAVNRAGMMGHVIYESAYWQYAAWLGAKDRNAKIGFIIGDITEQSLSRMTQIAEANNNIIVSVMYSNLTTAKVNMIVERGYELMAWTLNTVEDVLALDPYVTWVVTERINANQALYDYAMDVF